MRSGTHSKRAPSAGSAARTQEARDPTRECANVQGSEQRRATLYVKEAQTGTAGPHLKILAESCGKQSGGLRGSFSLGPVLRDANEDADLCNKGAGSQPQCHACMRALFPRATMQNAHSVRPCSSLSPHTARAHRYIHDGASSAHLVLRHNLFVNRACCTAASRRVNSATVAAADSKRLPCMICPRSPGIPKWISVRAGIAAVAAPSAFASLQATLLPACCASGAGVSQTVAAYTDTNALRQTSHAPAQRRARPAARGRRRQPLPRCRSPPGWMHRSLASAAPHQTANREHI